MIAYNRDDVPVARAPPEYHRWTSHCTNYVYRADPVAYAPRAVACRFGWNAYIGLAAPNPMQHISLKMMLSWVESTHKYCCCIDFSKEHAGDLRLMDAH